MNNIFTIMKKELFRYLSDRRMLLTTILLPGLMIYIVYSIMGQAMSSSLRSKMIIRHRYLCWIRRRA